MATFFLTMLPSVKFREIRGRKDARFLYSKLKILK